MGILEAQSWDAQDVPRCIGNTFLIRYSVQIQFRAEIHPTYLTWFITDSNMTSFFRFVTKRAIYRLGIISLAHSPVHVTDFPVVNVHVDELSSARIWQHTLCATLSANININYRLPIKVYYRICTFRHTLYQNRNKSWKPECVLIFNMDWRILVNFIRQSMLKLKSHSGFHDLFLNYSHQMTRHTIYLPLVDGGLSCQSLSTDHPWLHNQIPLVLQ